MSVKKWIGLALAAAVVISAGILIVTAGLMKWRKQVNYPPDSSTITARGTITFNVKPQNRSVPDQKQLLPLPGYVQLYAAEPVNGFLNFQDALGRNNASIPDISLFVPSDMAEGSVHRSPERSPKLDKTDPVFLFLNSNRLVSFVCSTVPVPVKMGKDEPVVYSCGFSVEEIPGQHGFIHEAAQAFVYDAGKMGVSLTFAFIADSTADTSAHRYVISHCTLNIL